MAFLITIIAIILTVVLVKKYDSWNQNKIDEARRLEASSKDRAEKLKDWGHLFQYNYEFQSPQQVTGDFYNETIIFDDCDNLKNSCSGTIYSRCSRINTSACVNCARRMEHIYSGKFRYSNSSNCYRTSTYYE